MKVTKQQKVAIGVLAVALAAFGVDRLTQSDSAEVASATPTVTTGTGEQPKRLQQATLVFPQEASIGQVASPAMARRLSDVADAEGLQAGVCGDGFRPPAEWFASGPVVTSGGQKVRATNAADRATLFKSSHKLTATLRNDRRPGESLAVIHGRSLKIGQAIDGFTLASVQERSATLTDGRGTAVELELPRPDVALAE